MATPLTNRSYLSKTLHQIVANQRALGIPVHAAGDGGWTIWGTTISTEFDGLFFNFWDQERFIGLLIFEEDTRRNLLTFSLHSDAGGNAASLARLEGDIWLLHTGRVFPKHARPSSEEKIEVEGRSYFKVARIDDPEFVRKVLQFHLSREPAEPSLRKAIDTGPFKGGTRTDVIFEARHAPIVQSLVTLLAGREWQPFDRYGPGNPDLVVERDGRKVLFEVKSGCEVHDLICAVGQCKVYDLDYQTDRQIIVALRESEDGISDGVDLWISEALRELQIELVFASQNGPQEFGFGFDRNDELVTRRQ